MFCLSNIKQFLERGNGEELVIDSKQGISRRALEKVEPSGLIAEESMGYIFGHTGIEKVFRDSLVTDREQISILAELATSHSW